MFSISKLAAVDVTLPVIAATGAFSGLGSYMTLGLSAKTRPNLTRLGDKTVLLVRDSMYSLLCTVPVNLKPRIRSRIRGRIRR